MKKFISIVMIFAMLISALGGLSVSAAGTKRVYLLNEGFEGTPSYTTTATKGVSILDGETAGVLSADGKTYGKYLHLKETDGDLSFNFEKGKIVTLEFDMYNYNETNSANNNLPIYLNDSDVNLISGVGIQLHRLYVYGLTKDGKTGEWAYDKDQSAQKWHHIKIVANGVTNTYQAWINGVQAAKSGNNTFTTRSGNVTGFDWLRFVASANANRLIDNIKILTEKEISAPKKIVFEESFEGTPSYTTTAKNGVSIVDGEKENILSADGKTYGKYLKATATDGDINMTFKRGKKVAVEFDVFNYSATNEETNNVDIYINDSKKSGEESKTYGAGIRLHRIYQRGIGTTGDSTWMYSKAQEAQKWHHIKVVANAATDSYEAWVNGEQVSLSGNTEFPTRRGFVSGFDIIRIASSDNVNRLFDNFKVTVEEEIDYLKYENFEAEPYEFDTAATSGVSVGNDISAGNSGSYLHIKNNDADTDIKFDAVKKAVVEFDFYNPLDISTGNILTMYINDSSISGEAAKTYGIPLIIEEDRIRGMVGSEYYEMCKINETKVWNHIKVLANAETDTFDIWLNDNYIGNYAFRRGVMDSVDWIRIAKGSGNLLIDNIAVKNVVDSAVTGIKYFAGSTALASDSVTANLDTIIISAKSDDAADIVSEGIEDVIVITDEYGTKLNYTYSTDVEDDLIYISLTDDVYYGVTYTVIVNGLKDTTGKTLEAFADSFTVTGEKTDNKGNAKVSITDTDGNISLKSGGKAIAVADVHSWGDMPAYNIVLSYYDKDGKLIYVEVSEPKSAMLGIKASEEFEGTYVIGENIETVKAFIWNSQSEISPFSEACSLTPGRINEDKVYNLVTTFCGDEGTARGFAWSADTDYSDMAIQYAEADENWEDTFITEDAEGVEYGDRLYYKADIENLEPGENYVYRIGDETAGLWSDFYNFTTEPEELEEFSFIGFTDTQSFQWSGGFEYFEQIIDEATEIAPDAKFMISLGDMVDSGYEQNQWDMYFDALNGHVESLPHMAVVGNHETRGDADTAGKYYMLQFNNPKNGKDALGTLTADDMEHINNQGMVNNFDGSVYSFDYGNAHFAVLNSGSEANKNDSLEMLSKQAEWLKNDMNSSDKKWKILMIHEGMYPAKAERFDTREALLKTVDECGIDLVLQGHDHMVARTYPMRDDKIADASGTSQITAGTGTVYCILGSAGAKRYADVESIPWYMNVLTNTLRTQPTYSVFNVDGEKLSVVTRQLDGTIVDEFAIYDEK